ncbi:ankyrin repeat domain-containing protein [Paenibacillus sp. FSL K6-0276]|uniref:ankyrin repeat domain-containing protein n=1 Tax=Paenibacillus sp. FSL K6-0276 TaxID=2921450 RepID=UPI0030EB51F9
MGLNPIINDVFQAGQSGDALRLNEILEAHPSLVNTENNDGLTLLGYAAHFSKKAVVQVLLDNGAQTNIFDSDGHTALHSAAFHADNVEMIRLLIEHGADIHAKIEGGESALAVAIQQGNHNVKEFLIEKGAI